MGWGAVECDSSERDAILAGFCADAALPVATASWRAQNTQFSRCPSAPARQSPTQAAPGQYERAAFGEEKKTQRIELPGPSPTSTNPTFIIALQRKRLMILFAQFPEFSKITILFVLVDADGDEGGLDCANGC